MTEIIITELMVTILGGIIVLGVAFMIRTLVDKGHVPRPSLDNSDRI
ncbi:hypothetical protein [Corynebacterium spheniscorum]|uniref:Uncharacterized protein n=1 Tax=Corynebacterium spheniscorum TaxID=185761 RepID=A0A1I2TZB9_9CORY|nr:hypothetical protein [Corynebacterium spheniscorum]SFG68717.1 hypothetical protein SAMN05660282_01623 [Corynebacterium spheniscorum]